MLPLKIPTSRVVKSTVRSAFQGRIIPVSLAALTVVFSYYVAYLLAGALTVPSGTYGEIISVVSLLLMFCFILGPVTLGAVRYFWRLTDGADEGPVAVFYYFSSLYRYKRAIKVLLIPLFRCAGVFIICLLPYGVISVLSNAWIYQFLGTEIPIWVAGLALVEAFLQVAGTFVALIVVAKYYLVPVIAVMDENLLVLEAVHMSVMVSRRSLGAAAGLFCSLIGWVLLSTFVIPLIYTAPLFLGCYVVHGRYALVNYNLSLDYYNKQRYNEAV